MCSGISAQPASSPRLLPRAWLSWFAAQAWRSRSSSFTSLRSASTLGSKPFQNALVSDYELPYHSSAPQDRLRPQIWQHTLSTCQAIILLDHLPPSDTPIFCPKRGTHPARLRLLRKLGSQLKERVSPPLTVEDASRRMLNRDHEKDEPVRVLVRGEGLHLPRTRPRTACRRIDFAGSYETLRVW